MLSSIIATVTLLLPSLASAVVLPGADTPLFYLVASAPESTGVNLLPVHLYGDSPNYYSILTSTTAPVAKFHIQNGQIYSPDFTGTLGGASWRPNINIARTSTGSCATYGQLGFVVGGSTNKCSTGSTFYLQSNPENAQLGARLTFNWKGGFYVCGSNKEVWYKVDAADRPSGCTQIELYTVPVVE